MTERREFLKWSCRLTGGYVALCAASHIPPLRRVNTTLFAQAHAAQPCTQDTCSQQDNCGTTDTTGHTCQQKDVCTVDASGNCTNDQCETDSSQECSSDACTSDKSGSCLNDTCKSDASGACKQDQCTGDSSGSCQGDTCVSDKSGACTQDTCTLDKSAWCSSDQCATDQSARCVSDECERDQSGCSADVCEQDSIGCKVDRCNSDYSDACEKDVCVLDTSSMCSGDVCREDRSPACTASDSCALDLAFNFEASRRDLARMGFNKAMKWLYKIVMILVFFAVTHGLSHAREVIDSSNAQFYPSPTYLTGQPVSVPDPVGPFLKDCDDDGILEADTNGDGQCTGDPEVKDYDGDGVLELPPGTVFQGDFQFTTLFIPHNVLIMTTGPLSIKVSKDSRVFGVMRLAAGFALSAVGIIDNRTSAWLAESDGAGITFGTALKGSIREAMTSFPKDGPVPTVPPIKDTDNDGVPDTVEGIRDFDRDGIPNDQDQDTAVVKPVTGNARIVMDLAEGPAQRLDFCNVKAISDTDPSLDQPTKPKNRTFTYGLIRMDIVGLKHAQEVKVTFTFPSEVPANAEYWGYREAGGWYQIPIAPHGGGKIITLILKDNGDGDSDGLADGVISGPGGLAFPK